MAASTDTASTRQPLFHWAPFALALLGLLLLGDWLIDDAGISFAYARNLASGAGLVAQPGLPPVEGYSNFLWVLMLAPLFRVHLFVAPWTPKLLGAALFLAALAQVRRGLIREMGPSDGARAGLLATLLIATAAPLVIWSGSGLENGLLLLLAALLWSRASAAEARWPLWCGALAALLAMTRPDGLVYAAAAPGLLALDLAAGRIRPREALGGAARSLLGFVFLFGPFLFVRLRLFGRPLPQTYYAKRVYASNGEHLRALFAAPGEVLRRALDLLEHGLSWGAGPLVALATLAAAVVLARRRKAPRTLLAALLLWALAALAYLWLDDDWMGEYRFATIAIEMWCLAFAAAVAPLVALSSSSGLRRAGSAALALVALSAAAGGLWRSAQFAATPPTPFSAVERQVAQRFNALARELQLQQGSLFVADVGAALLDSDLRIFDAAGLTEPEVIRTLKNDGNVWLDAHPRFYDWLFETARPSFIRTAKFWTRVTALELDPRFARDYVALDGPPDRWATLAYRPLHGGEYVRRELLRDPQALERLRHCCVPEAAPLPVAERLREALLRLWNRADETAWLRSEAETVQAESGFDRLAAALLQLRSRSPADRELARRYAQALDDAGRFAEARLAWEEALRLADSSLDEQLGIEARDRLHGFFEPAPDEATESAQARQMDAAVRAIYRERRPLDAIAPLHQILARSPEHYGANYQLAIALDRAGRDLDALPLWNRVLALARRFNDTAVAQLASARLGAITQR